MTRLTEDDPIDPIIEKIINARQQLIGTIRHCKSCGIKVVQRDNIIRNKCDECNCEETDSSLCIYGYENCNEAEGLCEIHEKEAWLD